MYRFKKFCVVGGIGFVVDCVSFIALSMAIDNILFARIISFWIAASTTWLGNRTLTFASHNSDSTVFQWAKHMASAHLSGMINILVFSYALIIVETPIAFCLGVSIGTVSNYFFSLYFVFSAHSK